MVPATSSGRRTREGSWGMSEHADRPELAGDRLNQRGDLGPVGDVGRAARGTNAGFAQLAEDLVQISGAAGAQADGVARASQGEGGRPADAPGRPGDQRDRL